MQSGGISCGVGNALVFGVVLEGRAIFGDQGDEADQHGQSQGSEDGDRSALILDEGATASFEGVHFLFSPIASFTLEVGAISL